MPANGNDSGINVAETLAEIRRRVAARLSRATPGMPELAIPPLHFLREARAVVENWASSFGAVNPRPPGLVNRMAQGVKGGLSRSLRWFAFPQIQFNHGVVAALMRIEDMFADINRNLVVTGQNLADHRRALDTLRERIAGLEESAGATVALMGQDLDRHRQSLTALEATVRENAQRLDRMSADLSGSTQQISRDVGASLEQISKSLRQSMDESNASVGRSLDEVNRSVTQVEQRFWADFARHREEIQDELRLVRQRARHADPSGSIPTIPSGGTSGLDYQRFEQHFRGSESEILVRQSFYLPMLRESAPVLDVGCGRGEMLELLKGREIECRGVDLDTDMVARCHEKGLSVTQSDALTYLAGLSHGSLGAIFSAQFVEHLPFAAYNRLVTLAYLKLRSGGRIILETQNPECLGIYSQTFFIDPTHVKPVPAAQLRFVLTEAGFKDVEIFYLSRIEDVPPRLPKWTGTSPEAIEWNRKVDRFNATYFAAMDYAITGVKR